jgi:hypothetical protein
VTPYQKKKRDLRYGVVFQGFAAPHLYSPPPGMHGAERDAWNNHAKRLTTPNPEGRWTGASILQFQAAMAKSIEKDNRVGRRKPKKPKREKVSKRVV